MKYAYCTRNWKAEWIDEAKKKVMVFYRRYCREETEETVVTEMPAEIGKMAFNVNKWQFGDTSTKEDELTRYLNAPVLILEDNEANDAFDVLEWWRGNVKEFPILARIAFDIYSIPAMSVEPERVFSGYVPENRRI